MNYNWVVSFNDGQRMNMRSLLQKLEPPRNNPWRFILRYLKENPDNADGTKKEITHIELIVNGVRFNTPTSSRNSKFASCFDRKYWIFGRSSRDIFGGSGEEHLIGLSYRLDGYRLMQWVNTKNCSSYIQILNVENPQSQEEKDFAQIEKTEIETYYGGSS